jgi:magnesium and cobalt exporter, CNNM family
MRPGTIGLWISVFVLCVTASFLLSGMEAGVFALSRLRIRQQARSGKARAKTLHGYLENPENFLWTILVGNTVANFLIVSLLAAALYKVLSDWAVWFWVAFLCGAVLFYTVCDLFPKMLFRMYPNRLCMYFSQPFRVIDFLLRPLVSLMAWFSHRLLRWTGGRRFTGSLFGTRDELRLVMQESAQGLTSEERTMINRVLDLQNRTVREITVPLGKTLRVTKSMPVSELLALCRERHLSRLPVEETVDGRARIVGLVSLKTLLYRDDFDPGKTVGDYLKPALYLDEDMRLEVALRQLQRSGQRLAIVLGRDRSEVGIVSLQDILKAIFGEVSL